MTNIVNMNSGMFALYDKLNIPIIKKEEIEKMNFLVQYIPEAKRLFIKIIPERLIILILQIKTEKFTFGKGENLKKIFEEVDVILTSGIFIKNKAYYCEFGISFDDEEKMDNFIQSIENIKNMEFNYIRLGRN